MKITRNTWMLVALIFVGSMALTSVYFYIDLSKSNVHSTSEVIKKEQTNLPGSLTLTASSEGSNVLVGQNIDIILGGSSKNIPVSGYDAVITYDPTILSLTDVMNSRDEYNLFTNKQAGKVTITAGLKLSDSPTALNDSILASLQFKVLKAGKTSVSFEYTPGSTTDSNLLSEKTEDILGSVEGLTVRVGTSVVVSKNQPTTFEGKKLTLVQSTVPETGCADCQSIAIISVEENGKTQELKYVNGGIVGLSEREKTIGNTVYQLEGMKADSITLIIAKK